MRPIQATVSESALRHNLAVAKKHAPNANLMAVLKANAYGHGLFNVAQALSNMADGFAVLGLNEAIDLREAGFDQRIMLLEGVFDAAELNIAASFNLDVVVHHQTQIEMLAQASLMTSLNVYIKINTGMNRLGFTPQAFEAAYKQLSACKNVHKITLMTHFAAADTPSGIDHALEQFESATHLLSHEKTLANSASILLQPASHADWVRPGIMLYGGSPVDGQTAASFNLKPAMQFTSEIISVQTLAAGQSLGYGYRYTAKAPMRIGVVACGYADGYPRHAGQYSGTDELYGAPIAVDGQVTQTIGRVSMDMMACDLTQLPASDVGSPVELWGDLVPVDAVAAASGTIAYELLCAVAPRVPLKVID